jgi:hypothetical protein
LVSSTGGGTFKAFEPSALLIVGDSGEITSRKANTKLALWCQRLNLGNVILLNSNMQTIVGRWGVCAAFLNTDFAKNQITSRSL